MEYKNRKETPKAYKWDLTAYYKDDKEWEKDYLKIIKEFENTEVKQEFPNQGKKNN